MNLIDRFTALFGRTREATLPTTADEPLPGRRLEPFDLTSSLQADTERRATVKTCREMYKKDTRARGVIKALARDMTRGGFSVTVKTNRAAQEAADALIQRLDLEHLLDDWVRLTLRDGDSLLELGVNTENEIALVTRKPTLRMVRASNDKDRFSDPVHAFWLAPETWYGGEPPADATWFAEWQIVHARWDHDSEERYGQPLFASATASWKRIREGETDIAVRRKTRAGIKYNHKFPEGTTPDQIEAYKELNQDNLADPTAAIADFFGTADIAVVAGEGGALEAIGDVMHHVRTWWLASPLPMSLLGYGQDLNRDVLQEQKEQYDRALESLTQWVEAELVKPLLERQWLLLGILPAGLQYEVKWKTTETLKIATVALAANAVTKLIAAGLPKAVAWEIVERFLPGVDLTQAKAEMARETGGRAAQDGQNPQDKRDGQDDAAVTPAEAGQLAAVLSEYQRAAAALGALVEFNANQPRVPAGTKSGGQFMAGGGGGAASAAEVKLSYHAFQRMRERNKYRGVRETLGKLTGTQTPSGPWYCQMSHKGRLDGWLVGDDGIVKTVLGAWYNRAKLGGLEVVLAEAKANTSRPSVRRSIQWQLDNLTPEIAAKVCDLGGVKALSAAALRAGWQDWTLDGLESLLLARSEVEDAEPTTDESDK